MTEPQPKVLVVDDSRATLDLVTGYLSALDLETITASSAGQGLALARAHRPDLVLCDIVLPGRDGYAFVSDLRADPELATTPVVLMSGVSGMQDRMRAVDSGADDLLTKPFDKAELISRVKALLRLKAREDELRQANIQLRERMRLMSTLFVVGNQLRDSLDPPDIYRVIRETLVTIVGAEVFTIYVHQENPARYRLAVQHGLEDTAGLETLDLSDLPEPALAAVSAGRPFIHEGPPNAAPAFFGQPLLTAAPIQAVMPPVAHRTTIGLINVHAFAPGRGDRTDFELVALLSSQVAGAIHAVRLYDQLRQHAEKLERSELRLRELNKTLEQQMFHLNTLTLFSAQLHSTVNLREIYQAVRDLLINFIGAEAFFTRYSDEWEGISTYAGAVDGHPVDPREIDPERFPGLVGQVEETGIPFFRTNPDPAFETLVSSGTPLPVACLPLVVDDKPRGVLVIESLLEQKHAFTEEDYELLALLTREAALAIHNGHLHRHVERLSVTDGLTGVYNRRYFDRQLPVELKRSRRYGHALSLVLGDIDDFKAINDEYGHLVGDEVLREIARRLNRSLRDVDLVTRYGGEEFALILPQTAGDSAATAAERAREATGNTPVQCDGLEIPVTLSLGVASYPPCEDELSMIMAADRALRHAKRLGKDRVVSSESITEQHDGTG